MRYLLLATVVATLCACAGIDPDAAVALMQSIDAAESSGAMTAAQAQAAREALAAAAEGVTWPEVGAWIGGVATAAVSAFLGVQRVRGPSKPMQQGEVEGLRVLLARSGERGPAASS